MSQSAAPAETPQRRGGIRTPARDERRAAESACGTNGESSGTNGEGHVFRRAWLIVAVVTIAVVGINSLTVLHDHPHLGVWEPWVWEGSSAVVILAILWIPWLARRAARPEAGMLKPRFWLIHALGLLAFSFAHVAGFTLVRIAVYALIGRDYGFNPLTEDFFYELRKDALSYALFQATFWALSRFTVSHAAQTTRALYDIRDGGRVIRVPLDSIVAVTSAGNYVEFWLVDGRKPLMRAPLTSVEGDLGGKGFVRTHRSWLVNRARVTGLKPGGSGDWSVELGEVKAPLSRRFPEALKVLRDP